MRKLVKNRIWSFLMVPISIQMISRKLYGINAPPKNEYRKQIYKDAKSLYPDNLRRQALYFDQHTYLCSLLDRNDRCTMGASIECREPFLDPRLIVGLGSLDDKWLICWKKMEIHPQTGNGRASAQ